jgi:hypothetical protein
MLKFLKIYKKHHFNFKNTFIKIPYTVLLNTLVEGLRLHVHTHTNDIAL